LELSDPILDALLPQERVRILQLLLERVDYRDGKLRFTLRRTGIRTLAGEAAETTEGSP